MTNSVLKKAPVENWQTVFGITNGQGTAFPHLGELRVDDRVGVHILHSCTESFNKKNKKAKRYIIVYLTLVCTVCSIVSLFPDVCIILYLMVFQCFSYPSAVHFQKWKLHAGIAGHSKTDAKQASQIEQHNLLRQIFDLNGRRGHAPVKMHAHVDQRYPSMMC